MFEKEHLKFEVLNHESTLINVFWRRNLEMVFWLRCELHCAVIQPVSAQPQRSHGIHQFLSAFKKKADIYTDLHHVPSGYGYLTYIAMENHHAINR
jgi:hypothetical protein